MPFYDFNFREWRRVTRIGRWIVRIHSLFILKKIFYFHGKGSLKILEIGPGKGYFADLCAGDKRVAYSAIEANKEQTDVLKKKNFDVTQSFVPPIEKAAESFDVVLLSHVLEHMNDCKTAISLIEDVYRVLKKSGIIVIVSPDFLSYKEDFFNVDYTHNYVTTVRRVRAMVEDGGFKTIHVNYCSGPLHGKILASISSYLVKFLFAAGIPYLFARNRFLDEKVYTMKVCLLRSLILIGRKAA